MTMKPSESSAGPTTTQEPSIPRLRDLDDTPRRTRNLTTDKVLNARSCAVAITPLVRERNELEQKGTLKIRTYRAPNQVYGQARGTFRPVVRSNMALAGRYSDRLSRRTTSA
jgi:hypothetical protein